MKIFFSFLLGLFPALLFADGASINFNPPAGDYSVVFLGNIFGIVEGVLHGSGSQILGNMFSVFNSAVMAIGSIVIMYTMVVGTMNTAHEGQFLGQKWSSIWLPMRSVFGMSLLIPQASGYCMMQIFVMWIVVQGVGAADKVWNVALNYLNRGGVIVQEQIAPSISLKAANWQIAQGASAILQGQVCMLFVENLLGAVRTELLANAQQKMGPCYEPTGNMQYFCTNGIPDFVSSVNSVSFQQAQDQAASSGSPPTSYQLNMPNLSGQGVYDSLSGVCGVLKWNNFYNTNQSQFNNVSTYGQAPPAGATTPAATIAISQGDLDTAKLSRAIAIQQMYVDLATVAQAIFSNVPLPNATSPSTTTPAVTGVAINQFGVPQSNQGVLCPPKPNEGACVSWGADAFSTTAPLFNGTEFQGAITDYNAIMMPTLRLLQESSQAGSQNDARTFIAGAEQQGWMMAGSYFFYLAQLNAAASNIAGSSSLTDGGGDTSGSGGTGLQNSILPMDQLNSIFQHALSCPPGKTAVECACGGSFPQLCQWLNANATGMTEAMALISGSGLPGINAPMTASFGSPTQAVVTGDGSSTVIGFINNSMMMNLPGQPGMQPPKMALHFNFAVTPVLLQLPEQNFPCGGSWWSGCIGRFFGNVFYNFLFRTLLNMMMNMMSGILNNLLIMLISQPLLMLSQIFLQALDVIQHPSVNPVVALANMGVEYINFSTELWMLLTILDVTGSMIPVLGMSVILLTMLIMPLVAAWLGIMVAIGFTTAYYVPFLPYMIFTFGSLGWLMAVIEAMVAAPIVALGVCFPEGHEAFGKSEAAVMILMNVFLRPAMMVIGYIAAIILSYVSVWVLNAGFANALVFMQGNPNGPTYSGTPWGGVADQVNADQWKCGADQTAGGAANIYHSGAAHAIGSTGEIAGQNLTATGTLGQAGSFGGTIQDNPTGDGNDSADANQHCGSSNAQIAAEEKAKSKSIAGQMNFQRGYPSWAGIFGFFMGILLYTMTYLTVVQEAFNLIHMLPDKVMRWIGGGPESYGQETGKWAEQVKGQMDKGGEATSKASQAMGGKMQGGVTKALSKNKGKNAPAAEAKGS
ncbi:MAG: type IVB secretion system protein DotA [Gammaproteobacteria bacterium]|nr:type IVB secretion system protein DotA [Gammaproteobacteria bacterium]